MTLLLSAVANAEVALGNADAPVTIVEYGSLTCGYCVRFHREVLPIVKSRHVDSGLVRFIYRDFPTSGTAVRGAVAARCSGDNYHAMLDALYATVDTWSRARDVDAALSDQAALLGLDRVAFRRCLGDSQHTRAIEDQQRQAVAEHGVTGTPTFLINHKIVRGIQDIDNMEALIQQALPIPSQPETG